MPDKINKYLSAELLVVSDIHIRQPLDSRAALLEQLLSRSAELRPVHFVLLGDIFDFYLGGSRYFQNKFAKLGGLLTQLSAAGTKVVFFEGNHEFDLLSAGLSGVVVVPDGDYRLRLSDGKVLKMAHGDLVYAHWRYRAFRGLVKSRISRLIATAVPASWIDTYALGHAKVSRSQDKYRVLDHEALLRTASQWLDDGESHHGMFGHFHIPYGEPRPNSNGLIMSVDSWDKPNALVFTAERGFERLFWSSSELDDFRVEPVRSFQG